MVMNKASLHRTVWVALVAILMAAWAPTLSTLLTQQGTRSGSTAWVEICRGGGGTAWVAVANAKGQETPKKAPSHGLQHCPYCALHADALPQAPVLPRLTASALPGFIVPAAFLHAPHTAHVWQPAQSRAPPVLV